MMDVCSFMQRACRVHLLEYFEKEQTLEDPQLGRWAEVSVHEHLPPQVPRQEVQLAAGQAERLLVHAVEKVGLWRIGSCGWK